MMLKRTMIAVAMGSMFALPLAASAGGDKDRTATTMKAKANAQGKLARADDNAYITLTGTVTQVRPDSFVLDHGSGKVTVEMNDWGWYRDGSQALMGEKVTVQGRIDEDWIQRRTLEADSVYAQDLNTYHYTPVATMYLVPVDMDTEASEVRMIGTVTGVDARNRQIEVRSNNVNFAIDTSEVGFDPMDNTRPYQVNIGDRIVASGDMKANTGEGRRHILVAKDLILLEEDRARADANLARLDQEY